MIVQLVFLNRIIGLVENSKQHEQKQRQLGKAYWVDMFGYLLLMFCRLFFLVKTVCVCVFFLRKFFA